MKTITNTIYFAFAAIALACLTLSPAARAVSPAPDGGYPNNNTAEGSDALFSLTTGTDNTAIGFDALYSNTGGGVFGNSNTAVGSQALYNNSGSGNTATGVQALYNNSLGGGNTATGVQALFSNTTGDGNTATGLSALYNNTTGIWNTANGYEALASNTTGNRNTANGSFALDANTTGNYNTANGYYALQLNTTGNGNTANGHQALASNTTGIQNTANGTQALLNNRIGTGNIAEGFQALANNTGSFNVAIGYTAGIRLTTGRDNIDIVALGAAGEPNTIRIGTVKQTATFIAGISGVTGAGGVGVIVGTNGKLGTVVSSARFKEAVQPMDKASEAILALKPVTFRYKKELDPEGIPQFGLVAEDVENVNPALVARDEQGKPYTVRYEAVNAMLLNEFLKEHRTVQGQQKEIDALRAELKEQRSLIQKVNDEVELSKPARQTVLNNR